MRKKENKMLNDDKIEIISRRLYPENISTTLSSLREEYKIIEATLLRQADHIILVVIAEKR